MNQVISEQTNLKSKPNPKYWAWIRPNLRLSPEETHTWFSQMRDAGIDAILPQIYNSRHALYQSKQLPIAQPWLDTMLPLAKATGLEVHAWMWTMPCNISQIQKDHPEWFVVNGKGESAAEKPIYVDYYKFLCANQPGVPEFIQQTVSELAQYEALDGIHLDYIRFPDVILASVLQKKYNIVQDREYPEYDYCYCDACRAKFEAQTGLNPLKLTEPSQHAAWRQFRYDTITHLVNAQLIPIARQYRKTISAAVFPNWENVRQQWFNWHLDAAFPMLYHSFYKEDLTWIKSMTRHEANSILPETSLYSGLLVSSFSPEDLGEAIQAVQDSGARGVALFSGNAMTLAHWEVLKHFTVKK